MKSIEQSGNTNENSNINSDEDNKEKNFILFENKRAKDSLDYQANVSQN